MGRDLSREQLVDGGVESQFDPVPDESDVRDSSEEGGSRHSAELPREAPRAHAVTLLPADQ